jgi:hypothetical protein
LSTERQFLAQVTNPKVFVIASQLPEPVGSSVRVSLLSANRLYPAMSKDLEDEDDWGGRINAQRPTVRTITLKEDFPANLAVLTSRFICGRALSSALHHIYETYKNL